MQLDVTSAVGTQLDDLHAGRGQARRDGGAEVRPGLHALEAAAVHLHGRAEVQVRRRAEQLLEVVRIGGLWQEGEDAAAVATSLASPGLQVVELRTDRARNVELHRRIWAAVAEAVWRD